MKNQNQMKNSQLFLYTEKTIIIFISPPIKESYTIHFSSCVIKKSQIFFPRPQHQNTSRDFKQIGEQIGKSFSQVFSFALDCDLSSGF